MLALQPDFFVHTGDIIYYDHPGGGGVFGIPSVTVGGTLVMHVDPAGKGRSLALAAGSERSRVSSMSMAAAGETLAPGFPRLGTEVPVHEPP